MSNVWREVMARQHSKLANSSVGFSKYFDDSSTAVDTSTDDTTVTNLPATGARIL